MYSNDLKIRAINLYNQFKSYRYISKILNIGKSTINRWVIQSKNNNTNNKIIKYKFDKDKVVVNIKKYMDNNKFITIKQIQKKLNITFKNKFSLSFIYTIIKKTLKYSYKKISKKTFGKSIKDLKNKQKQFIKETKNIDTNNIISIDETYIHSNYCYNYGWAKIGKPIEHYVKSNPIKYSIIMAISKQKIVNYKVYNCNINSNIYLNFMNELNTAFTNHYFLMDNVSFHKSKQIKQLFSNSTNKLLYILPYSPQFNPIEEVFAQIKRNITVCNNKNIIKKIVGSIKKVNSIHLTNYYNHSFSYIIQKN